MRQNHLVGSPSATGCGIEDERAHILADQGSGHGDRRENLPISFDALGTLHSHCYHALGRPEIAEGFPTCR